MGRILQLCYCFGLLCTFHFQKTQTQTQTATQEENNKGNLITLWSKCQLHLSRSSVINETNKNKDTTQSVTKQKQHLHSYRPVQTQLLAGCFCLENKAKKRKSVNWKEKSGRSTIMCIFGCDSLGLWWYLIIVVNVMEKYAITSFWKVHCIWESVVWASRKVWLALH